MQNHNAYPMIITAIIARIIDEYIYVFGSSKQLCKSLKLYTRDKNYYYYIIIINYVYGFYLINGLL